MGKEASQPLRTLECDGWWATLRRVLSSLLDNNVKDWIDEGSLPIVSLWYGTGAQSGPHPPSIRSWENVHRCSPR